MPKASNGNLASGILTYRNRASGILVSGILASILLCAAAAHAQIPLPSDDDAKPDPATLFANQCGTCHIAQKSNEVRQGPNLFGVYGRHAGTYPGFKYSAGFAKADWVWDEAHLDRWLTNPQAMIPGAVMLYHQDDPAVRHTIIGYLKEQH